MILDDQFVEEQSAGSKIELYLKDNKERHNMASRTLMFVCLLVGLSTVSSILLWLGAPYSMMFKLIGALDVLVLIAVIVAAVLFIMWFRRAYFNLNQFRFQWLYCSEGWAAGAWFVPIVNLFFPYRIMLDLDKGYGLIDEKSRDYANELSTLIGWWWGFWIVSRLTNQGMKYFLGLFDYSFLLVLFAKLGFIAAGILLIRIMREIHARENRILQRSRL